MTLSSLRKFEIEWITCLPQQNLNRTFRRWFFRVEKGSEALGRWKSISVTISLLPPCLWLTCYRNTCLLLHVTTWCSIVYIQTKGGSRHKEQCYDERFLLFIRHLNDCFTLHRNALAEWAACLDPRLRSMRNFSTNSLYSLKILLPVFFDCAIQ